MNRRSFLQGVLALAALGPLARRVVAEEIRQQQREEFLQEAFHEAIKAAFSGVNAEYSINGVPVPYESLWTPDWEEAKRAPQPRPGPTVLRAHVLFGEWADLP